MEEKMPTSPAADKPRLSVVVPFYNEEENAVPLAESLAATLNPLGFSWEAVFVDDGSTDGTREALRKAAALLPAARLVFLRRNFGQTAALAAGFDHAKGEILVALDGDQQNDPADIPRLLKTMDEGYDVVSGWRRDRQDPFLTRILPSLVANRLIGKVTGLPLHDYGCTLKAYRANLLKDLPLYGEMHRFIPLLVWQVGARIVELPVAHKPRLRGRSKYGLGRTFKVFLDLLTLKFLADFSTKPLYFFGGVGALLCISGTAAAGVTLWQKYVGGVWVHRNPLLMVAIFLFSQGMNFFLMGLLADLLVRTSRESSGKSVYRVREVMEGKEKS
jgi:glycosyltransferase involved in cell wall biosynthesis